MLLPLMVVGTLLGAEPLPLALVGFSSNQTQRELAGSLANTFAQRMTETKLVKVTTPDDVAAVLGLERQKQLMGCGENSCVAELAGALGAKGVVSGALVRVGVLYQLTVKVLDAQTGSSLFSALERQSDEATLLVAVDRLAQQAAHDVALHFGVLTPVRVGPVLGLALGGALLVAGGVLQGLAAKNDAQLRMQLPTTYDDAVVLQQQGITFQGIGIGLLVGGGVATLGSLVWLLIPPSVEQPRVSVLPTLDGVLVQGSF